MLSVLSVLAQANDGGHKFTFFVVDQPSINAFALPGGYIGVHTGLIEAIAECGRLLEAHRVEIRSDDKNELSNELRLRERWWAGSLFCC